MLKLKRIKLSGFRGILNPQVLDLTVRGSKEPRSLVLFGLNSSGKTSFVDGLEWFLSEESKIDWLRRDEAEEKAYPHQEAKDKGIESSVETEFFDSDNKIGELTKTYDYSKITKPALSNEIGFKNVYSAFVIRPYFRYLEIVDFVYCKGKDKYEKLAQWMGFESEFNFQEKIAREVHQKLKDYTENLASRVGIFEQQLKQLINGVTVIDDEVLYFCNGIFRQQKIDECKNITEVWRKIPEINKKKIASSVGVVFDKLTRIETSIIGLVLTENLCDELIRFEKKINDFRKDRKLIEQIDVIELHTQAFDILTKQTSIDTRCPVCGKEWEREKLMEHIKVELELLKKTREEKKGIEHYALFLKAIVDRQINSMRDLINRYRDAQETISEIKTDNARLYLETLIDISNSLAHVSVDSSAQFKLNNETLERVITERNSIMEQIKKRKDEIQPSEEDKKLSEDIEKLTQIKSSWQNLKETLMEQKFTFEEINNFYALKDATIEAIQENIESRFKEISEYIGKYFGKLRNDKDITDIEVKLNKERGRAAGRTAEIQLNYYNISVKPAYKVLSESLLNSLGLAVYFTCVKKFNDECKFIVLDDIMNSLDIDKRDTLLDLIEEEFSDYQIIIFTHDLYWFQRIVRRFPNWIHKKIKGWDYIGGSKIDSVTTTKREINECLSDAMRIEEGGWKLGRHAESILNELCENLWAAVRYRYAKNEPPAMEELFDALYSRLKDKVKMHPIVQKVLETKKYEPTLRNFVSHPRDNQPSSLSPQDIKRASDEWFSLESEFWCDRCNHFVEYYRNKDKIECRCGNLRFN